MKQIKLLPPFKNFILENFPFIEEDFDALTNYELLCHIVNYVKVMGEDFNDIITGFNELKSYVDNFFDTLDVQNEVNIKLDEMAEDGTLENMISKYINDSMLIICDSLINLLEINATAGQKYKTLGYYEKNDGGCGLYYITDEIPSTYYETLSNGLYAVLIVENNTINVKQIGAKGDGVTDDTEAIQKAINIFHVGTDDNNQNYATVLIRNYPSAGGTIYFPKAIYCISSTIKVPCYVDLDLGYSTIKAISGGTFTNNYMMSVNSFNVNGWTYEYVPRMGFIKDGIIKGNDIENIKGIYIADPHKIENIEFNGLYNSINYPSGIYVDNIYINSIQIQNSKGEEYQIIKTSQGENTYIENIHIPTNDSNNNVVNGLRITNAHGGHIRNILNGNIYFYNCEDVTIQNWHCEHGSFYGNELSNNILRDCNIYVRGNSTPITLRGESANNNNRVTYFENVKFIYYLQLDQFNYETKDIDISNYLQQIFIKGCYRYLWTESINSISTTGITIYNGTNYLINPYDDVEIYNKNIVPQSSYARRDEYIFLGASTNNYLNWNLLTGTYYYKMVNLSDVEKLCGRISSEQNVNVSNENTGVRLSINGNLGKGNILRIYRGQTSGNYTHYVDIPSPKTTNLYDNGFSINGYHWKALSNESVITTVNPILNIERINTFTNILVRCKGYDVPSVGTWTSGDIVEITNPQAVNCIGYVCTVGGTSGTWKKYGAIFE